MLIYIRHGDDRRDRDAYRHDRRLRKRAKKDAARLAAQLVEKYGHPEIVRASPFRRAVGTAETMVESLQNPVMVVRDIRLAQHLSEKQQANPDVSPQTLRSKVAIHETDEAFQRRIDDHVAEMKRSEFFTSPTVVWCVTHTIVVEEVAARLGISFPQELNFLAYVVVGGLEASTTEVATKVATDDETS